MATLVHDDLIDGAECGAAGRSVDRARADAARAGGRLPVRARVRRARARPATRAAWRCSPRRALALARGEALQRRQRHDPETPIDAYLERCALKTGKLFEAACLLGGGTARRVRARARDRIPDRRRHPRLRRRHDRDRARCPAPTSARATPTLPLLLAAREDEVVRAALAGGPLDGALVRVAATGALERSREVALDYARRARELLDGHRAGRSSRRSTRRRRRPRSG